MQPEIKKIHFVGIGGIGMSGLAEIMISHGYRVSGSDRLLSPITQRLENLGIKVTEGHQASAVDADLVVYTSAASSDNPEIREALSRGIPCIKRSVLLGELLRDQQGIAIAGTHGKTTTTAMMGMILRNAKLDPSIVVGGVVSEMGTNAVAGKGRHVVVEADEYDRSFLDLHPRVTIINNIESDHLDCYRDLDDIRFTFADFANQTSVFGFVVLNTDDEVVNSIRDRIHRRQITTGFNENADVRASSLEQKPGQLIFDVDIDKKPAGQMTLPLSGRHNVSNALACIATAHAMGVKWDVIRESLSTFQGTGRRFENLGTVNGITFIDDYAHHPTEIRSTLEGAKKSWPSKRIIAAFQPHLYSRTRDYMNAFATSFKSANLVVLTDIYPAREQPIAGVTGQALAEETKKNHGDVHFVKTLEDLKRYLRKIAKSGDIIITMGAGDITVVGRELVKTL